MLCVLSTFNLFYPFFSSRVRHGKKLSPEKRRQSSSVSAYAPLCLAPSRCPPGTPPFGRGVFATALCYCAELCSHRQQPSSLGPRSPSQPFPLGIPPSSPRGIVAGLARPVLSDRARDVCATPSWACIMCGPRNCGTVLVCMGNKHASRDVPPASVADKGLLKGSGIIPSP